MDTISIMNQFPTTKESMERFFNQTKDLILSGERNPLELAVVLKAIEDTISKLRKDEEIENSIQKEFEKHRQKNIELYGGKMTLKETGVKYDYSRSLVWLKLTETKTEAENKVKEHESFLKTLKDKTIIVDEKSGETFELWPPVKTSLTKVTVSII